ncbi:MAG TPA: hypothetical protein VHB20_14730 [Verrucomicrobiae bacterium]|jgi:hypothetical protein|nr:hypothetical protein [Verrucomicrobiae bacterium]
MNPLLTLLNAADTRAIAETNFQRLSASLAYQRTPSLVAGVATAASGPPTAGAFTKGQFWVDANLAVFMCSVAGTPGTWIQIAPGIGAATPFGQLAIPNGVDRVTVTGLALAAAPTIALGTIVQPAGGLQLFCTLEAGSLTTDGFTFTLNAHTDSPNYFLNYAYF